MPAPLKIALHDVPEPEALARIAERGVERLCGQFPSILGCRLVAERVGEQAFEVHVELLFPERQVIFNRVASTPDAALQDALAAVSKPKPIPLAA